jgi:hypothetical protein
MPDLKFKGGKFYFSLGFTGNTPLLIPRISNPDFLDKETFMIKSAPGIKQLLEGDLGITEMIMMKVLDPVFASISSNMLVAEAISKQATPLDESNTNAIPYDDKSIVAKAKAVMLGNYIPKDNGLKALEKTIITTMMESHKPIFDFAKILIDMLGIAEDVVCRFLGTSIKVLGKEVGFPSRNPAYWDKSLGYTQTMSYSSKDFQTAFKLASNEFIKTMSPSHPLKGIDDQSTSNVDNGDNRDAIYVGYFDENGKDVEPPLWVINSNKWVKKDVLNSNGDNISVGSPFKRLSIELSEGVEQIRQYHMNAINKLEKQKQDIIDALNKSVNELESTKEDIDHIETQKEQAIKEFDKLIQSVYDMIDGTNINGGNYIDDEDISKGINAPVVLTEWVSKTRASQLRQKYFPETVSTVQSLVDKKGEPIAPYTFIPKVKVDYRGKEIAVESPLAYSNQVEKKKVKNLDVFYNKKQGSLLNTYSEKNIINSYDVRYRTNKNKPYEEINKTWFMHNDNDVYLPDSLKNYYLPIEWEELLEYEIRNKETGAVIRKEYETTTRRIDIENDYELRVIKVINRALPLATSEKLDNINTKNTKIDPLTGTIYNKGNNIPQVLIQGEDGKTPLTNLHSTPDINEKNLLKEGIIKHGLDPRFPKSKVFFLIEALKKDDNGLTAINGKYNENETANTDKGGSRGKEWYGLLDKFTAFPMIATKLLPLIGGKLIPLIIEILQLIQNPMKIKQMLLDLVLDKKISKFPINFPHFDKDKGVIGKVRKLYSEGFKVPERFEDDIKKVRDKAYYAGAQIDKKAAQIISMIDGQAVADFGKGIFDKPLFSFGVNIQTTNIDKPIEMIKELKEGVKQQPIISVILSFIKLPFEVIFKIFMWIINWVKKLLNPMKIAAAIKEFITFKWLFDIISKDSLFKMLGMVEPNLGMINKLIDAIKNKDVLSDVIGTIREGGQGVETLVYDLFKNGIKVGTEVEKRPYVGNKNKSDSSVISTSDSDKDNSNLFDIADLLAGLTGLLKGLCGEREFNLNDLLPIPFLGDMPDYNLCELPLLFLKPLELIGGLLHMVQELLNALISMPLAIFGLEPHIKIPKFGKEIPMFDKFEEMLQALRDSLTPPVVTG